ncbi:MAG: hypothetical protein R6X22_06985 [Gemmatimonadota bacterium]
MRRSLVPLGLVALAIGLVACGDSPTAATSDGTVEFDPVFDFTLPPDGGTCPDVYYESSQLLDNGVTVTWTSALGGFDYVEGADYVGTVDWSVDLGSTAFVGFTERSGPKTWTPWGRNAPDVEGTMTPGTAGDGTIDVTVNMTPMHISSEDYEPDGTIDWEGLIGNGHFWLLLDVDDGEGNVESVKLGVNFHLEDPADGYLTRCPS